MTILSLAKPALSQEVASDPLTDLAAWTPMTLKLPVHKKLSGYMEVQPRWHKLVKAHFTELLMRTGLDYELNKHVSVAGGYYITNRFDPETFREWRWWQQVEFRREINVLRFKNRARIEEMYCKDKWEGGLVRFRNQLHMTYQLPKSKWYLAASEEPFFYWNSPEHGPSRGFAQNRLFVGFGRKMTRYTRIEAGYLNRFGSGQGRKPDVTTHGLVVGVTIDLRELKLPRPKNWRLAGVFHRGSRIGRGQRLTSTAGGI